MRAQVWNKLWPVPPWDVNLGNGRDQRSDLLSDQTGLRTQRNIHCLADLLLHSSVQIDPKVLVSLFLIKQKWLTLLKDKKRFTYCLLLSEQIFADDA